MDKDTLKPPQSWLKKGREGRCRHLTWSIEPISDTGTELNVKQNWCYPFLLGTLTVQEDRPTLYDVAYLCVIPGGLNGCGRNSTSLAGCSVHSSLHSGIFVDG